MNETPNTKARRGSGPRTNAGKRKAAANAFRHGLAVGIGADPFMGAETARIAAALAGPDASPGRLALIQPIAEAQADVMRARAVRISLINLELANIPEGSDREAEAIVRALPRLTRMHRYEQRAMGRRSRALRLLRKAVVLGQ